MSFFLEDPGDCPICGAAHSGCKGDRDDSTGVGHTRGVIVRVPQIRQPRVVVRDELSKADEGADAPGDELHSGPRAAVRRARTKP